MKRADRKILNLFFLILFTLLLIMPGDLFAGLLRFESDNYGSVKNGEDLRLEMPLYEYLAASYSTNDQAFQLNGNIGFFEDPLKGRDDFYLYVIDATYTPLPDFFKMYAGRFLNIFRSVDSTTTDTVGSEFYLLDKQLSAGGFWGVERELEMGNFSSTRAYISGVYSSYQTPDMFPYTFYLKYLNRDYSNPSFPVENVMQGGVHKAFPGLWNPEMFFDTEVDVTSPSHLKRLEVGTDLYTSLLSTWRLRGLIYNFLATEGVQQPIFSIFSQGILYEASAQFEYRLLDDLVSSISFSYDNYLWQNPTRTNGYLLEFDLKYYAGPFDGVNTFFYFDSYGGEVFGDRLILHYKLADFVRLRGEVDYDYYEKVTSSERFSLHVEPGIDFALWDRFRLYLGGEFNSNNTLEYDFRFNVRLIYALWRDV